MPLQRLSNQSTAFIKTLLVSNLVLLFLLSAHPALADQVTGFLNPLEGTDDIYALLSNIARFLLSLVGFIAIIALVWGGILYIAALGQDKYIEQAKKIILWAVIGLAIALLAGTVLTTVQIALTGSL